MLSLSSCFSKDPVCSLPVILPSDCHELFVPVVRLTMRNGLSEIRHLMANLAQMPSVSNLSSFSSDCSNSSTRCSWKPACVHLGRRHILKSTGSAFWEHWRQLESQFKLAFRGLLMPNFCCLCTSRPFSAWGSASGCFCHERGVSVYCYCAQPLHFLLV